MLMPTGYIGIKPGKKHTQKRFSMAQCTVINKIHMDFKGNDGKQVDNRQVTISIPIAPRNGAGQMVVKCNSVYPEVFEEVVFDKDGKPYQAECELIGEKLLSCKRIEPLKK